MKPEKNPEQLSFQFDGDTRENVAPLSAGEKFPDTVLDRWTKNYENDGLTVEYVKSRLDDLDEFTDSEAGTDRLYVSSSDDLDFLSKINVRGKKIWTVAGGGGDFPILFACNGSKDVVVTDYSWLALLWTELKLAALLHGDRNLYSELFSIPDDETLSSGRVPLLGESYKAREGDLAIFLSDQARLAFERISSPEGQKKIVLCKTRNSLLPTKPIKIRDNSATPQISGTDEEYETIRSNVAQSNMSARMLGFGRGSDALKILRLAESSKPDIAFISNAGYEFSRTQSLASDLLGMGIPLIFFSTTYKNGWLGQAAEKRTFNINEQNRKNWKGMVVGANPNSRCGVTFVAGTKKDIQRYLKE